MLLPPDSVLINVGVHLGKKACAWLNTSGSEMKQREVNQRGDSSRLQAWTRAHARICYRRVYVSLGRAHAHGAFSISRTLRWRSVNQILIGLQTTCNTTCITTAISPSMSMHMHMNWPWRQWYERRHSSWLQALEAAGRDARARADLQLAGVRVARARARARGYVCIRRSIVCVDEEFVVKR